MKRTIQVFLGDTSHAVGTLRYDAQGRRERAAFEYAADWRADVGRFAIEPNMPLGSGLLFHRKVEGGSVFHGAIADTEPDGWARRVIVRDHAKRRQENRSSGQNTAGAPLNALDFLLAVDDVSRVGALRFADEQGLFQRVHPAMQRAAPPLIALRQLREATRAIETRSESAADLAFLRGRATSLGGMRPKCSVQDENGRLSIGKFPSIADDRPVTLGEVLTMRLAKAAGINAAETRIVDSDGIPVALIERFDRPATGGRLLYVSAATMIGAQVSDGQAHTYTEIVEALRQHGAAAQNDIDELWRRIAFSILVTNVDDHLHNHGFLHASCGTWRLAPAFDINPFPDRARELKTWISEDTGPAASIEALMSVLAYFKIPYRRAKMMLSAVESAVVTWRQTAQRMGMLAQDIDAFADAFEHEERIVAQRYGQ